MFSLILRLSKTLTYSTAFLFMAVGVSYGFFVDAEHESEKERIERNTVNLQIRDLLPLKGSLKTQKMGYVHNYGDTVKDIGQVVDVYVICTSCPETSLRREIAPPILSVMAPPDTPTSAVVASPGNDIERSPGPDGVALIASGPSATGEQNIQERGMASGDPAKSEVVLKEKTGRDCILATVNFDLNRSELKADEMTKLNKMILSIGKGTEVAVKGYTCDLGSKAHNDVLALKRAQVVANFLAKNGMKASAVSGTGKCCYISPDLPVNRRTEVSSTAEVDPKLCEPSRN